MDIIDKDNQATQPSVNAHPKADYPPIKCMECKIEVKPRVKDQRFCSRACRQKYHNDTYYAGKAARMVLKHE